eukprot:1301880-Pyramimonas_sp.AAC.1
MGQFWFQKGVPYRWKRCVLLCHVVNAALAGVEAFVPTASQLQTLELAVGGLARKAMRREASWEEEDGRRRCLSTRE